MLQALVEAGAWLLRISEEFRHSVVVLREVKNVKYGTFVEPGRQLKVTVDLAERGEGLATFKGKGEVDGQSAVSARLSLATYNLADTDPALAPADERLVQQLRERLALLRGRGRSKGVTPGTRTTPRGEGQEACG